MSKGMIIRAKTFDNWLKANLKDYTGDLARHGAAGGFPGLTYYTDTVKLFERYKEEIFDALYQDTDEGGHDSIAALLATFNRDYQFTDYTTFANNLVWWYAERWAQRATDQG